MKDKKMEDIEAKKVELNDEALTNVVGGAGEEPPIPGSFFYDGYLYVVVDPQPKDLNGYKWCYRIKNGEVTGIIVQIPTDKIPS